MKRRKPRKVKAQGIVKVNAYKAIADAVDSGVRWGYNRAHKHVDNPTEEQLCETIAEYVMTSLSDVLDFDNE